MTADEERRCVNGIGRRETMSGGETKKTRSRYYHRYRVDVDVDVDVDVCRCRCRRRKEHMEENS